MRFGKHSMASMSRVAVPTLSGYAHDKKTAGLLEQESWTQIHKAHYPSGFPVLAKLYKRNWDPRWNNVSAW